MGETEDSIFLVDNLVLGLILTSEAVAWRCSIKKVLLEISQNSQENTCASVFFNKVEGLRPATLLKKRLCYT